VPSHSDPGEREDEEGGDVAERDDVKDAGRRMGRRPGGGGEMRRGKTTKINQFGEWADVPVWKHGSRFENHDWILLSPPSRRRSAEGLTRWGGGETDVGMEIDYV